MALYFLLFDLFLKYLESPLISVLSWGNYVCTLIDYNASSSVSTTFSTQILSTCAFWCGSPWYKLHNIFLKHWPNGVASYRKLKTCINLRLRLVMTWVYLRWLAMACVHFHRAQICTQVNASFSSFGRPTQVDASCSQYRFPLSGRTEMHWNGFLATCVELASTCDSVWPLIASLCSQVHIS